MQFRHSKGDIQVISENTLGDDLIIGDLHGNHELVKTFLNVFQPNNRLFFVGDFVDKGQDSLGVMEKIMEFKEKNPDNMFCVRGNHEDLCLDAIKGLKTLSAYLATLTPPLTFKELDNILKTGKPNFKLNQESLQALQKIFVHKRNGGEWLIDIFIKEVDENKIKITNGSIDYENDSKINKIENFMSELPYIVHCKDGRQFSTVHADMPISDKVLIEKMKANDLTLSDAEKLYSVWARDSNRAEVSIKDNGRDRDASIAYVGHSIIIDGDVPVVRFSTNTANIDVAAYEIDTILVVNHTKGICYKIEVNNNQLDLETKNRLNDIMNELGTHLLLQKVQYDFINDIRKCDNQADKIELTFQKWESNLPYFTDRFSLNNTQLLNSLKGGAVELGVLSNKYLLEQEKDADFEKPLKVKEKKTVARSGKFLFHFGKKENKEEKRHDDKITPSKK